jgi:hypothetical protein
MKLRDENTRPWELSQDPGDVGSGTSAHVAGTHCTLDGRVVHSHAVGRGVPGIASASNLAGGSDAAGSFGDARKTRFWSKEDNAELRADWVAGLLSRSEMAAKFGRSIRAIERQASKLKAMWVKRGKVPHLKPERETITTIDRVCLRCCAPFFVKTRFLRLCEPCRSSDSAGM